MLLKKGFEIIIRRTKSKREIIMKGGGGIIVITVNSNCYWFIITLDFRLLLSFFFLFYLSLLFFLFNPSSHADFQFSFFPIYCYRQCYYYLIIIIFVPFHSLTVTEFLFKKREKDIEIETKSILYRNPSFRCFVFPLFLHKVL